MRCRCSRLCEGWLTLTALALLGLVEYPLYHTILKDDHWIIWEVVWLRTGLLLLLSWEFFLDLGLAPSWERIRRPITAVAMLALVVWCAFMVPRLGQSWYAEALADYPSAALVENLARNAGSDGVVVFTEPSLYRELYPFLNGRTNMVLIDPEPPGSRIASAAGVSAANTTSSDELDQLLVIRKEYSTDLQRLSHRRALRRAVGALPDARAWLHGHPALERHLGNLLGQALAWEGAGHTLVLSLRITRI